MLISRICSAVAVAALFAACSNCIEPRPIPEECTRKVKSFHYPADWDKINALEGPLMDEPYWVDCYTSGGCKNLGFSVFMPPPTVDVPGITSNIEKFIANGGNWVNFSWPELLWAKGGFIPWPRSCRMGMDRYVGPCNWDTLRYDLDLLTSQRLPGQKLTVWVRDEAAIMDNTIIYACEHDIDTVIGAPKEWWEHD